MISGLSPAERRLRKAWHEATFMEGQVSPAAKHLFDAIHQFLKESRNARG
jgi:hypothetical protein